MSGILNVIRKIFMLGVETILVAVGIVIGAFLFGIIAGLTALFGAASTIVAIASIVLWTLLWLKILKALWNKLVS